MLDLLDQCERQRQLLPLPDNSNLTGHMQSITSTDTTTQVALKALEIRFFYPNMLLSWGEKDIIEKDGKLYYWNVYSFTNQICVASQTQDATKLKQVLDTCLCGKAEL